MFMIFRINIELDKLHGGHQILGLRLEDLMGFVSISWWTFDFDHISRVQELDVHL